MSLPNSFLTGTSLICLVCPDIETSVRRCWGELGIGPWEFYDFIPPLQSDTTIGGEAIPYTMRVAFATVGDVGWALLEPLEGPTIYADFLARKGTGVHHAALDHAGLSYDGCIEEFARRGYPVAQAGFYGGRYCYFPTREDAHIIFELVDEGAAAMPGLIGAYPDPADARPPRAPAGFERTVSLGLVTDDLDETLRVYADTLGIGPWSIVEVGDGASGRVRRASAMLGDFLWEIVEPVEGLSLYRDHLDRRGPSVHHIGVAVAAENYAARLAELAGRGFDTLRAEAGAVYLATDDVLGARLKLYADEPVARVGNSREIYPAQAS